MPELRLKSQTPGTMKAVFMTDPHFTDINPPSYKTDYLPILEDSVRSVYRYAEKQKADLILWGGDFFHRKSARQNSHALVARMIRLFREAPCPTAGIFGNHDLLYGSMEKGLTGQPVEVIKESGTFHLLDDGDVVIDCGDHETRVAGASYLHAQAAPVRDKIKHTSKWLISIGHFWFGNQSGEFFGEPIYGPDYLGQSEVDLYLIGHHHDDQGIQKIGGKQYASAGSISRTGGHKQDRERRPAAVFVESTATELNATVLRPKAPSVDEIMDLVTMEAIKKESEELDKLTAALDAAETTASDPNTILDQLGAPAEVRQKAKEYLERAEQE